MFPFNLFTNTQDYTLTNDLECYYNPDLKIYEISLKCMKYISHPAIKSISLPSIIRLKAKFNEDEMFDFIVNKTNEIKSMDRVSRDASTMLESCEIKREGKFVVFYSEENSKFRLPIDNEVFYLIIKNSRCTC